MNKLHLNRLKSTRILSFMMLVLLFQTTFAQNFNNKYVESQGYSCNAGRSRAVVEYGNDCSIATGGSIFLENSQSDFQLTLLKSTGQYQASFHFGEPEYNEYCHSICTSQINANEFLMSGTSKNNQMLVIKVNDSGDLLWSKEITFPYAISEGIVIAPFYNSPGISGYIVTGHANGLTGDAAVVAVRIDENGNIIWRAQYPSPVKIQVTDAIIRHNQNDRLVSVAGYENSGKIFFLNIRTTNGQLYSNPGANYSLAASSPAILTNVRMTEFIKNGLPYVALSFNNFAVSTDGVMVMHIDGTYDFTPQYTKKYYFNTPYYYGNASMINLSSSRLSILFTKANGLFDNSAMSHLMHVDYYAGLIDVTRYNAPYEIPASLIESCNSGYDLFTSVYLNSGIWTLRAVKQDNAVLPDCSVSGVMNVNSITMIKYPSTFTYLPSGIENEYYVETTPIDLFAFDCNDMPVYRMASNSNNELISEAGEMSKSSQWFYPNPASDEFIVTGTDNQYQLKLYSVSGQLIWNRSAVGTTRISLEGTASGVYILEKTDSEGLVQRSRLVIQ